MSERERGAKAMRQIDENLRRVYEEAASEPIPGRLQQLLDKLREQDSHK
jgi:hypothetical protein